MSFHYHHHEKWVSANVDLIEEILETHTKAVVFISGASSSGKSYCSRLLEDTLKKNNHSSCTISLDTYNFGLSGIITNKVNLNYFDSSLPNMKEIISTIKDIIIDIPFDKKYDEEALLLIKPKIKHLIEEDKLDKFINALNEEWKKLNFDEPTVYDMEEAAKDVNILLENGSFEKKKYSKIVSERIPSNEYINGSEYDVIIIEGIYALDEKLISKFKKDSIITNFIDGNPKSLFLRRIIRDSKETSASTPFTISIYFNYIIDSYLTDIVPRKEIADIEFTNNMTFEEMKSGDLHKYHYEVQTKSHQAIEEILSSSIIEKKSLIKDTFFTVEDEKNKEDNILRLRSYSDNEGKTYTPSSLVHKGIQKVRKDNTNIRPINIFIKEGEFGLVWKDETQCIKDFARAGFLIGPIQDKIKYRIKYKNKPLVIKFIKPNTYIIEFGNPVDINLVKEIKGIINKYE